MTDASAVLFEDLSETDALLLQPGLASDCCCCARQFVATTEANEEK